MFRSIVLRQLLIIILICSFVTPVMAQEATSDSGSAAASSGDAEGGDGNDEMVTQTLGDIGIVVGAGAGGALIGLSTLSFYQKPKEHWKNITVGGAIGVIAGVAIVVFLQATKTQDIETEPAEEEARNQWHYENQKFTKLEMPSFEYSFSF